MTSVSNKNWNTGQVARIPHAPAAGGKLVPERRAASAAAPPTQVDPETNAHFELPVTQRTGNRL